MYLTSIFPILIAHRDVAAQSVAGVRLRQLKEVLEQNGWKTIVVDNPADAAIVTSAHRGLAAILFNADAFRGKHAELKALIEQLTAVHERAPGLPVIALGEQNTIEQATPEAITLFRDIHSIMYLYEDTVPFL